MDQELRTYLENMEGRIVAQFDRVDAKFAGVNRDMQGLEDRMASLVAAEVGNLHTEMQSGFARVDERLNHLTDRLDRQGFILAGGTKALGGLLEHVTTVELNYDRMLGEVTELRGRIERLEKRAS